ncbi:NAD(P)/FAD-dependent oxidoreductase [Flexithrix dorotheae]|uniref:NAD(P)/FAD-dependent oxidoreductase n=1 Tax=Flexithrix dorotheae TaxID=70993 RepID=UPI0003631530|nr:NAD(P)/FAD-dependent oxidoreductase [Flexithrix dorotheae]
MTETKHFDVIIIGGSYSGLAAAMALGRALRKVLVIDSGKPCNRQTPHSHNFLTQDGKTPHEIATMGKQQVAEYDTVHFIGGLAINATKTKNGFEVQISSGDKFSATKLIFATGIKDIMPKIKGFEECWGISVLHCPYCHGYEVKNKPTGILGNGAYGFEFSKLISNWTKDVTLFTNGKSTLTVDQSESLGKHEIKIVEKEIEKFEHRNGYVQNILFRDGSKMAIQIFYTKRPFEQHCQIPEKLGCELTEEGYIKTNHLQQTSIPNMYASGDNTTRIRTVANAVSMGTTAGMMLNNEFVLEQF